MKYLLTLYIFLTFVSCRFSTHQKEEPVIVNVVQIPNHTILITDTLLQLVNGVYYYKQQPFSGTIQSFYANQQLRSSQTFYKGKEEGWLQTFYENGSKESLRYFHQGEKDSVHTAWWNNGNKRLEHQFKKGNYDGMNTEWFIDGKISKQIFYDHGIDTLGRGWRNNGKIFMSYVRVNGRRYGLMNAQPCYSVQNEKGEFVKSIN